MSASTELFQEIVRALPASSREPEAARRRLEALEWLLERRFALPGTSARVGLDALIGLVPGVGDVVGGLVSAYFIWEARNLGVPRLQLLRMAANIGIDTAVGAVPVLGDFFDLSFRSNSRNLRIIRRHLDRVHRDAAGGSNRSD